MAGGALSHSSVARDRKRDIQKERYTVQGAYIELKANTEERHVEKCSLTPLFAPSDRPSSRSTTKRQRLRSTTRILRFPLIPLQSKSSTFRWASLILRLILCLIL